MPVADNAIAPTRPPGLRCSQNAIPSSPPASSAPAATRISGRRMPAWAASTSSNTTPTSVTATPATARVLPIQPSDRGGTGRWGGIGTGGDGRGAPAAMTGGTLGWPAAAGGATYPRDSTGGAQYGSAGG